MYLVALGVGGKHIHNPPPAEPATAQAILSFAATIAGFVITYCSLGSDFTIYYTPSVPRYALRPLNPCARPYLIHDSWKIFMYSYLGFNVPIVCRLRFGAAQLSLIDLTDPPAMPWSGSGHFCSFRPCVE